MMSILEIEMSAWPCDHRDKALLYRGTAIRAVELQELDTDLAVTDRHLGGFEGRNLHDRDRHAWAAGVFDAWR
jgi:hypothetical protein